MYVCRPARPTRASAAMIQLITRRAVPSRYVFAIGQGSHTGPVTGQAEALHRPSRPVGRLSDHTCGVTNDHCVAGGRPGEQQRGRAPADGISQSSARPGRPQERPVSRPGPGSACRKLRGAARLLGQIVRTALDRHGVRDGTERASLDGHDRADLEPGRRGARASHGRECREGRHQPESARCGTVMAAAFRPPSAVADGSSIWQEANVVHRPPGVNAWSTDPTVLGGSQTGLHLRSTHPIGGISGQECTRLNSRPTRPRPGVASSNLAGGIGSTRPAHMWSCITGGGGGGQRRPG
jgi:hypothetical protein